MKRVSLISVPFDQDEYEVGMGQAPLALMIAGLPGMLQGHGVQIASEKRLGPPLAGDDLQSRLGYLGGMLAEQVAAAVEAGTLPVILGGDCMNAIGTAAGLRQALPSDFGIAWFDAHGDFNTPDTTLSGYLPGMPLACTCGYGLEDLRGMAGLARPVALEQVIMLGVRDLDAPEKELLDSTPISYLNPDEVKAGRTAVAAGYHFAELEKVYLHIDIDVLDPAIAPGVNYVTSGGLTIAEVLDAVGEIRQHAELAAVTLTAVNPPKDEGGRTALAAIDLLVEILRG